MSDDKKKGFFSTRSSRFFKLAGLSTRVSSSYTWEKLKGVFLDDERAAESRSAAHTRNASRIVETLGQLKGAVMKVGQQISIQADMLPKEFATILKSLQQAAPPVDYEVIAAQVEAELGKPPEEVFAAFEREPVASASIGQVHRARLADGTEVVAKIQYPGVAENIDGDVKNLRSVLGMGSIIGYRKGDLDALFSEIRARLLEELDYGLELENLRTFREKLTADRRVLIPQALPEYSARRVLTMEYLPGDPLDALLEPPYTQNDRDYFGHVLVDLYCHQILELGLLHADPHPGNFAFRKDGALVLYDFGCLKRIPADVRAGCREIVRRALAREYDRIDEMLLRLGPRDPQKEDPGADFYRRYVDAVTAPFASLAPYDYGTAVIHEKLLELAPLGLSQRLSFKPAPEMVFIMRVVSGHYGNLRRIRAKGCWRALLESYLG